MPFDYKENRVYTVDYKRIIDEIMEHRILSNKNMQIQYLSQWINILQQEDDVSVKHFSTEQAIMKHLIMAQNEPEIFQLPIHWKYDTLFIHFRASIANELCKDLYSHSIQIPISEFQGDNQHIYWTKVKGNLDSYAGNDQPIIIVPYFSGKNNEIVIDGNHRLTYSVNHSLPNIRALTISEKSVIEQQIFSSSFDKMLYIFNNELVRFGIETAEGKGNDLIILQKSYLCGKGFQFEL